MRLTLALASALAGTCAASFGQGIASGGKFERQRPTRPVMKPEQIFRRQAPKYLNNQTSSYLVNGTGIPDVDFDVGESYAGSLPISGNANETSSMFFWFFPTVNTNPAAEKEIIIWLNGGPGCSSLEGLLQENGPFLWQYGTFKPVANPWSWHRLANMVWVEQPVGTGFSTGNVTATSEDDVAEQFMGFWSNFVDLFALQGYKVFITGESFAGQYCPYIASHMLDANDTTRFDVQGMMIYDPVLTYDEIQNGIVAVPFVDYNRNLHPFNDSFTAHIHNVSASCGYDAYLADYLVYPPAGYQPSVLPGVHPETGRSRPECASLYWDIQGAALDLNPCWDVYQVATTCPLLWDVLGFPGTLEYLPAGAKLYFDRADVKRAIHAPLDVSWAECAPGSVFAAGGDTSPPSALSVLPGVIDRTQNVIIGHGALDYVLIANGTLLAIQNMTFGGQLGFQSRPDGPLYVPYHDAEDLATLAGQGVMGTAHTERGLTYVGVDLSGHMVPQYAPSAAFRTVEFLLGRVESLSAMTPFTVGSEAAPQQAEETLSAKDKAVVPRPVRRLRRGL